MAIFSAVSTASDPELVKKTLSKPGGAMLTSRAGSYWPHGTDTCTLAPTITSCRYCANSLADSANLTYVAALDPIWVNFNIGERDVLAARRVMEEQKITLNDIVGKLQVDIGLQTEKGFPHKGVVDYIAPQVSTSTGTLAVRGIFDNPDRAILPGYFVRVRFALVKDPVPSLLVPDAAVGSDQSGRYVLVVTADNVVEQRKVVDLPLVTRNPLSLAGLQSGITGIPSRASLFATEQGLGINANGQRESGNNAQVDGVTISGSPWGGSVLLVPNGSASAVRSAWIAAVSSWPQTSQSGVSLAASSGRKGWGLWRSPAARTSATLGAGPSP